MEKVPGSWFLGLSPLQFASRYSIVICFADAQRNLLTMLFATHMQAHNPAHEVFALKFAQTFVRCNLSLIRCVATCAR